MALKRQSASETKASELAAAIIRIVDREGAPANVGVDRLRQANPRLTPLAIGQLIRRHRDGLDAALADRRYVLVDYGDLGTGLGMTLVIALTP